MATHSSVNNRIGYYNIYKSPNDEFWPNWPNLPSRDYTKKTWSPNHILDHKALQSAFFLLKTI